MYDIPRVRGDSKPETQYVCGSSGSWIPNDNVPDCSGKSNVFNTLVALTKVCRIDLVAKFSSLPSLEYQGDLPLGRSVFACTYL